MEPVEVLVRHNRYGEVRVMASSRTEAICRAAVEWDRPFTELVRTVRIGLRPADLERLRAEAQSLRDG